MVLCFDEKSNLANLQCVGFWCRKLQDLLKHQYPSIHVFLRKQYTDQLILRCGAHDDVFVLCVLQVLQSFNSHYIDTERVTLTTHFCCWEFYSCCHSLSLVAFVLFLFWSSGKLAWWLTVSVVTRVCFCLWEVNITVLNQVNNVPDVMVVNSC